MYNMMLCWQYGYQDDQEAEFLMNSHFQWEDHFLPLALKALKHEHAGDHHPSTTTPLLEEAYHAVKGSQK